jgi:hypothetical protein
VFGTELSDIEEEINFPQESVVCGEILLPSLEGEKSEEPPFIFLMTKDSNVSDSILQIVDKL